MFVNKIQVADPYITAMAASANIQPPVGANLFAEKTDPTKVAPVSFTGEQPPATQAPPPVNVPPVKVPPAPPVEAKPLVAPQQAKEMHFNGLAVGKDLKNVYAGEINGVPNYLNELCIA